MRSKTYLILFLFVGLALACNNGDKQSASTSVVKKKKSNQTEQSTPKTDQQDPVKEKKVVEQTTPLPPNQIAKAKEIIAAVNQADVDKVDGVKKFKLFCSTCHGFKGDMMVNGAKDLTVSKIDLVNSVAQVYHGKGLMTPFKGVLKDHEIVAVCNYIETLRK